MIFSQIGLLFDIIGVLILFRHGLPSKYDENKGVKHFTINQPEEVPEIVKRNKAIKVISYTGLILIILGFVFQFIGTFKFY